MLSSYLVILILDAKALSQVSEHLWAVLFEFKLARKILPGNKSSFIKQDGEPLFTTACQSLSMVSTFIIFKFSLFSCFHSRSH